MVLVSNPNNKIDIIIFIMKNTSFIILLGRAEEVMLGATINRLHELGSRIRRVFARAFIIKQVYDSIL
jgi:hypothetical protein